jgi:hypothetical protein
MHALVVQKEILVTIRGLRKPLFNFFSGSKKEIFSRR